MGELTEEPCGTPAAGIGPTVGDLGAEFAENARLADMVAAGVSDEEIERRLRLMGLPVSSSRVRRLRQGVDEKDSEPGELGELYARVELALDLVDPAERLLMRRVVDAAAPLLALRYRREGRLQANNAITWNTVDIGEAELMDRLYAERCAGEEYGARAGLELADKALTLAAAVLECLDRNSYSNMPPRDLLADRRGFRSALDELRAERVAFNYPTEEAQDDPADDR